jgi:hypothetical protein
MHFPILIIYTRVKVQGCVHVFACLVSAARFEHRGTCYINIIAPFRKIYFFCGFVFVNRSGKHLLENQGKKELAGGKLHLVEDMERC